jgi:hypothetical protein
VAGWPGEGLLTLFDTIKNNGSAPAKSLFPGQKRGTFSPTPWSNVLPVKINRGYAAGLRTMRRRLCHLATVISLVLCLAMAALWVRSRFVGDALYYTTNVKANHQRLFTATSANGVCFLGLHTTRLPANFPADSSGWTAYIGHPLQEIRMLELVRQRGREFIGFGFMSNRDMKVSHVRGARVDVVMITLPHAAAVIAFAAAPAIWTLVRYRRRRRVMRGLCPKCGYILRGITEPRCPECGEKI